MPPRRAHSLLVTGASGYLGRLLLRRVAASPDPPTTLVALDLRAIPESERLAGVHYVEGDVGSPIVKELLERHAIDTVVHLAFAVSPSPRTPREKLHAIDVLGTENVLVACAAAGVGKIIVTSSGAAYGYHADNPVPLAERDRLRGNEAFAYSHHKRLVEERLERFREEHPEIGQLVFRVGAVLGAGVDNQISALFERRFVLELAGSTAPFAFVWDEDVVGCLVEGVFSDKTGIYNVAGDGTLAPAQIARILGKRRLVLPVSLVKAALWLLSRLRLSPYGPEQTLFLQYRPVLSNARLKEEFGYVPRMSSEAAFRHYAESKGLIRGA